VFYAASNRWGADLEPVEGEKKKGKGRGPFLPLLILEEGGERKKKGVHLTE